jgi:hypothetical protein
VDYFFTHMKHHGCLLCIHLGYFGNSRAPVILYRSTRLLCSA